jgi:hypothetical protein
MQTQQTHDVPSGVFRGQNFMTPEWLGYFKRMFRGVVVWIELSTGRGMSNQPIFGVSFRDSNGAHVRREDGSAIGGCFQSRSSAMEYINGGAVVWEEYK